MILSLRKKEILALPQKVLYKSPLSIDKKTSLMVKVFRKGIENKLENYFAM